MIDWTYIKQLETDVGEAEFKNVVALFLDEVDSEIELLRTPGKTPEILKSKMHFLKGSAYYLGFKDFGDLCAQNELLADTGRAEDIDLSLLISVYDRSRSRFLDEAPKYCSFVTAA
jgi:HPt (histidine-containing phosphotransfer) domain-containing protein